MFDAEDMAILNALENDTLARSIDADEEIALARKAAKELSPEQKNELSARIESYHNDRSIGKSWSDIKGTVI
jgi:hypothetical protein